MSVTLTVDRGQPAIAHGRPSGLAGSAPQPYDGDAVAAVMAVAWSAHALHAGSGPSGDRRGNVRAEVLRMMLAASRGRRPPRRHKGAW